MIHFPWLKVIINDASVQNNLFLGKSPSTISTEATYFSTKVISLSCSGSHNKARKQPAMIMLLLLAA